eukprot:Rhum_TRINITY_DN14788_c29_g1::Rhum_TRINITY_DN14788_c29_g1_i1::g.119256::m.119256
MELKRRRRPPTRTGPPGFGFGVGVGGSAATGVAASAASSTPPCGGPRGMFSTQDDERGSVGACGAFCAAASEADVSGDSARELPLVTAALPCDSGVTSAAAVAAASELRAESGRSVGVGACPLRAGERGTKFFGWRSMRPAPVAAGKVTTAQMTSSLLSCLPVMRPTRPLSDVSFKRPTTSAQSPIVMRLCPAAAARSDSCVTRTFAGRKLTVAGAPSFTTLTTTRLPRPIVSGPAVLSATACNPTMRPSDPFTSRCVVSPCTTTMAPTSSGLPSPAGSAYTDPSACEANEALDTATEGAATGEMDTAVSLPVPEASPPPPRSFCSCSCWAWSSTGHVCFPFTIAPLHSGHFSPDITSGVHLCLGTPLCAQ